MTGSSAPAKRSGSIGRRSPLCTRAAQHSPSACVTHSPRLTGSRTRRISTSVAGRRGSPDNDSSARGRPCDSTKTSTGWHNPSRRRCSAGEGIGIRAHGAACRPVTAGPARKRPNKLRTGRLRPPDRRRRQRLLHSTRARRCRRRVGLMPVWAASPWPRTSWCADRPAGAPTFASRRVGAGRPCGHSAATPTPPTGR